MKKSLADRIEQYLKVLIDRSEENEIEIQRAELAETFSCVPSQVTYVLSTRFTENEGYYTSSRRGGKGFVRITRCNQDDYCLNDVANRLFLYIDSLYNNDLFSRREAELIKCICLSSLHYVSPENRDPLLKGISAGINNYLSQND